MRMSWWKQNFNLFEFSTEDIAHADSGLRKKQLKPSRHCEEERLVYKKTDYLLINKRDEASDQYVVEQCNTGSDIQQKLGWPSTYSNFIATIS